MAEVLTPGTVVAGYRLDGILGEGGMGLVYEATQLSLDRKVALKIVAPGLSADTGFCARFRREGLIQARVEHPNIVTVYEAGEYEGLLFLAMRLVRGASLKEMIRGGELDAARSLRILHAVGDALDSAHDAGLIHRDVKPHNILVGSRDYPYLADFGITKSLSDTGLTRTGQFMGSLDYIAPEQIRGESASGASDIYALGAVLFECLTGIVPFVKDSEVAVLYAHVATAPPKVSERRPDLPAELDAVIAKAMAKEPAERPATAARLIEEAEGCFVGSTAAVINALPPLQEPAPVSIRPAPTRDETVTDPGSADPADLNADSTVGSSTDAPTLPAATQPSNDPASRTESPHLDPTRPPLVQATSAARSTGARLTEHDRPLPETLGRRGALLGFALVAFALAWAGFAVGHGGSDRGSAKRVTHSLVAGVAKLSLSTAWRASSPPAIPGLTLEHASAAKDRRGSVLVVGLPRNAVGRRLLPEAFLHELAKAPTTADPVKLGEASAYRYRNLSVTGLSQPVTVLVSPTSAGVVGILCLEASANASASCEPAASTLRLTGAKPLPLGPSSAYSHALSSAISKLRPAHRAEQMLTAARTRAGQAHFSEVLAGYFTAAARVLAKARPGPDAATLHARMLAALASAAQAYSAIAQAARAGRTRQFQQAGMRASSAQTTIRSTLASLRATGYS